MTAWWLVPSRARPRNVARLVSEFAATHQADSRLHFAFDEDDPQMQANIEAAGGHAYETGPRDTLAGWTNTLADLHPDAEALGSLGDDMVPVTPGWDARLLAALPRTGGFSYPNDRRRTDVPEAVLISGSIVAALGGMCPRAPGGAASPVVTHWFLDNIWRDLAVGANCLAYCPHVVVEHRHPNTPGGDPADATYADAAKSYRSDLFAYQRWRLYRMRADIALVRGVRASAVNPQ